MFLGETVQARYARTIKLEKYLRTNHYHVVVMWSCVFENIMRNQPRLMEEARLAGALAERLRPRMGYYGVSNFLVNIKQKVKTLIFQGRTEVFKIFHEVKPGESIRYFDLTSMYPCKSIVQWSIDRKSSIFEFQVS